MSTFDTLISGNTSQTTTMPAWYDQAQQNLVSQATTGAAAAPALNQTVAGQAINNLSGPNNPFMQGQNYLNQAAYGAANPWIVGEGGNVTPNTASRLGGLFQAQQDQLKANLPGITSPGDASSISGGNFGSLRGMSAANSAIGKAQADLNAEQMRAALQNESNLINAGTALGNIGAQGTSTMSTLGELQRSAPLTTVAQLSQILRNVNAPQTVTQNYRAPLAGQIGAIEGIAKKLGIPNLVDNISQGLGSINSGLKGLSGLDWGSGDSGGYVPGFGDYSPTDTSGYDQNTWPSILGGWTGGNTDTDYYSPTNTTGSPNWNWSSGQSDYYTGGGYDPGSYTNSNYDYSYDNGASYYPFQS
jgi:hypothetical protein